MVMNTNDRHLSASSLQSLRSHMTRFLTFWKASGCHLLPKHHFAWHLIERAELHGNPRFYWTYPDESENRLMGEVAHALHGGDTFYTAFLQRVLPEVGGR